MSYKNEDFYRGKRPSEKPEERDYRGWAREGSNRTLCVGHFLDRKRIALYVQHEADPSHSVYTPLAYFRSEEAAETAMEMIEELIWGPK